MATKALRCAIYTRKSSEEGLEQGFNSLHAQREACEAYVLSQAGEGWIVLPTIYDDGGFSGGSMERPALAQLLADIETQTIDIVVVYKVDRLTRALSDFARIVEIFDKRGVSFVSVTQAFNTTSSMGRLTLNVLLSFAQFEREVTGERIRDKIAASKAKGMWMGGNLPLGYDIPTDLQTRALVVQPAEAETIRLIFQRYLDLGSVRALSAELLEKGVVTKQRITGAGHQVGGGPWREGPLYYVLKNRIYRGDISHKGKVHPGRHAAIVSPELFDEVQKRLSAGKRRRSSGMRPVKALLTGKLFDDQGHPMSPVTVRRGSRTYRYYVSQAVIRHDRGDAGSTMRVPAWPLETLIGQEVARATSAGIEVAIGRVELGADKVTVSLTSVRDGQLVETLQVPARLKTWGGAKRIVMADDHLPEVFGPDEALLRAIGRARRWEAQLATGERTSTADIATAEGVASRYVDRVLQLAWLAPDLTEAFVCGARLRDLDLTTLIHRALPICWLDQRDALAVTFSTTA
ncbi:MAG: recombinase family protein [Phenylobacterium sp.]|uniref:recombinase family protein n=1 Tax=Phenylobacterium sp. TaxID=1871053 RepID=UPI003BB75749